MSIIKCIARLLLIFIVIYCSSCKKIKDKLDIDQPDITPLQDGIRTSSTMAYCVSLAVAAFNGESLPNNILFESFSCGTFTCSGIISVTVDNSNPLPFNPNIGEITIAGIWDTLDNEGVITAAYTNIDILESSFEFYGIQTIPIIDNGNNSYLSVFAEQDIVVESDSLSMHINMSRAQIDLEVDRLNDNVPVDPYVAVTQNVWFVDVDNNGTLSNLYDDKYTINGGGQIGKAAGTTATISYHALIETDFDYDSCMLNPLSGVGFIQSFSAGSSIDFSVILLDFHNNCDGKANVDLATGKYFNYGGRSISLNLD